MSWGIAEEAGKAARWLSARDLPGAESVADLLLLSEGRGYEDLRPASLEGVWKAVGGGFLCPLISGACLSDRAGFIGGEYVLSRVAKPILLASAVFNVSKRSGRGVRLLWADAIVVVRGGGWFAEGAGLLADYGTDVVCGLAGEDFMGSFGGVLSENLSFGRSVASDSWGVLERFRDCYLAPDTAESRVSGAGSGVSDND